MIGEAGAGAGGGGEREEVRWQLQRHHIWHDNATTFTSAAPSMRVMPVLIPSSVDLRARCWWACVSEAAACRSQESKSMRLNL